MSDLNRRNTGVVEQVIKDQNKQILDQQIRIDLLNTAVSDLSERLIILEKMFMLQKAQSTGSGPSVR